KNGEIKVKGLMVLEAVSGEAIEIAFEKEETVEGRVALLDGDVPGQQYDEEECDSGPPDGASQKRPLAAKAGEEKDDAEGEERSYGAFGERGWGAGEVE